MIKDLIISVKHAIDGIISSISLERNVKIHFLAMFLTIIAGFIFNISIIEWFICILLFGMVISLELVNTAIEMTVNICMPKINPKAKLAKDVSAGAVLIGAITALIVGLIIFVPKILFLINNI